MMRLIVVTDTAFLPDEAQAIRLLLDNGVERVHLRKPDAPADALRRLIESLPTDLYPRLSLHDHFSLAVQYHLGGVHLNGRNPVAPAEFRGLISRSCHSIDEAAACRTTTDYRFLSPVFDSISKRGYRSSVRPQAFFRAREQGYIDDDTFALGGVEPQKLALLQAYGFGGAALLGYIWQDATPHRLIRRIATLRKYML